jgi:hypothetical protein
VYHRNSDIYKQHLVALVLVTGKHFCELTDGIKLPPQSPKIALAPSSTLPQLTNPGQSPSPLTNSSRVGPLDQLNSLSQGSLGVLGRYLSFIPKRDIFPRVLHCISGIQRFAGKESRAGTVGTVGLVGICSCVSPLQPLSIF